jgi:hypothetical protein
MFFSFGKSLARIVGTILALRLDSKVRGLPEQGEPNFAHPTPLMQQAKFRNGPQFGGSCMKDHGRSCTSMPWERTDVSECEEPQMAESGEAETIRRAQEGDATAFERIYRLHSRRIYALSLHIVRNPTEAEV